MRRFSSVLIRSMPRRCAAESNLQEAIPGLSQYHSRIYSSSVMVKKPYLMNPYILSPSFQGINTFLSYNKLQNAAHFSSLSNTEKAYDKRNQLKVEIISEEYIKPASPTPNHLRTYEVSVLDQIFPHNYTPFVYFYPNNQEEGSKLMLNHDDLISKRRQLLKQSLSETLSRFYPLAGKVKDSRHIDCNDDGVYYVEAKVNCQLSDFLNQPDYKSIHRFLPVDPNSIDLLFSKTYVAMIQVSVFGCGGISIGCYISHKIIDAQSYATFFKAWAATAYGCSSEKIYPSFISPSIFPPNPALPANASLLNYPNIILKQRKTMTRRFLFSSSSITTLKKKLSVASTRAKAVIALIWKCIMAASKAQSKASNCMPRSSVLTMPVNLRGKAIPPISPYAIGNIYWLTPCRLDDDALELNSIVQCLENTINQINHDFIEKMKGEEWSLKVQEILNEKEKIYSDENTDYVSITSLCNSGIHNPNFGWGKPIWVSIGNIDVDIPVLCNVVVLMDTNSGNGIEAWVTLSVEDMVFFESDPELLAFASLDPNPLELVD